MYYSIFSKYTGTKIIFFGCTSSKNIFQKSIILGKNNLGLLGKSSHDWRATFRKKKTAALQPILPSFHPYALTPLETIGILSKCERVEEINRWIPTTVRMYICMLRACKAPPILHSAHVKQHKSCTALIQSPGEHHPSILIPLHPYAVWKLGILPKCERVEEMNR